MTEKIFNSKEISNRNLKGLAIIHIKMIKISSHIIRITEIITKTTKNVQETIVMMDIIVSPVMKRMIGRIEITKKSEMSENAKNPKMKTLIIEKKNHLVKKEVTEIIEMIRLKKMIKTIKQTPMIQKTPNHKPDKKRKLHQKSTRMKGKTENQCLSIIRIILSKSFLIKTNSMKRFQIELYR
jgi:hypothetical protein